VIRIVRRMAHVVMIMTRLAGSLQALLMKFLVAPVDRRIGIVVLRYALQLHAAHVIRIVRRLTLVVMITMRLVGSLQARLMKFLVAQEGLLIEAVGTRSVLQPHVAHAKRTARKMADAATIFQKLAELPQALQTRVL